MGSQLLTVADAAKLLGVSGARVRQFCGEGRFGRKHGRQWIIRAVELRRFQQIPKRRGGRAKKNP